MRFAWFSVISNRWRTVAYRHPQSRRRPPQHELSTNEDIYSVVAIQLIRVDRVSQSCKENMFVFTCIFYVAFDGRSPVRKQRTVARRASLSCIRTTHAFSAAAISISVFEPSLQNRVFYALYVLYAKSSVFSSFLCDKTSWNRFLFQDINKLHEWLDIHQQTTQVCQTRRRSLVPLSALARSHRQNTNK